MNSKYELTDFSGRRVNYPEVPLMTIEDAYSRAQELHELSDEPMWFVLWTDDRPFDKVFFGDDEPEDDVVEWIDRQILEARDEESELA